MRSKHFIALLMLAAWTAQPARAESTSDSLTRLEAETMVLKARERLLEVQSSILGRQNEIAARQSMMATLNQAEVIGDPVVRAIEGVGGRLYATLQMSDGSIVDVQQGDTLPGGMKILSIAPREVIAESGRKKIRLAAHASGQGSVNSFVAAPGTGAARPGAGR